VVMRFVSRLVTDFVCCGTWLSSSRSYTPRLNWSKAWSGDIYRTLYLNDLNYMSVPQFAYYPNLKGAP
jgi:hypothetical protein